MGTEMPFGPGKSPMVRELARKAFHLLSLTYLAVWKLFGIKPFLVWTAFVVVVETWRLRSPGLNAWLTRTFGGLARDDEHDKYSGIIHTTFGALIVFVAFGDKHPHVIAAAIYCVAFGDAAAALIGRMWGRHKLGTNKSLEGSAACLITCYAVCGLTGFSWYASAAAAASATAVEFLPTTRWFNDNLWMPVVTATVLCAAS